MGPPMVGKERPSKAGELVFVAGVPTAVLVPCEHCQRLCGSQASSTTHLVVIFMEAVKEEVVLRVLLVILVVREQVVVLYVVGALPGRFALLRHLSVVRDCMMSK